MLVVLMNGFAHKTLCLVACKILQLLTAVVAGPVTVMAACRPLITPLPHVEVKEVEVEVVGCLIHIHKEFPQPLIQ